MNGLKKIVPFFDWIRSYNGKWFKGDLMAGLTVGIMLIPQGMAYAMIAGLPPVYGLYAALVPLVIYSFLGTSRQLAVGPVAMDSLFVAATVSVLAIDGNPSHYIQLTLLLTFLMGALQFTFGIIRLGFLVNFLSRPVIVGFTTAAALIIAGNQLKYILGIEVARNNKLHLLFADVFSGVGDTDFLTLCTGIIAIVIIVLLKKINKKIPSALVLVVLGIVVVYLFNLESLGLNLVGEIPSGLPEITTPQINTEDVKALLPAALALALIAFMEAISVGKALEEKSDTNKIRPNQELIALGASNIIGSFFSSYVVTGGFSRSAVNEQAGAKTAMAGIISAVVILLTLLFLTDIFYYLPKAVLAAIILVAVIGLIDTKVPVNLWKTDKKEFLMYLVTLVGTLVIGITEGIGIGVLLSLVLLIYKVTVPHMAIMGRIPNSTIYKNIKRFPDAEVDDQVLIVRFDARLFYANFNYFRDRLVEFERGKELKAIVIDASGINSIDTSAIQSIKKMNVAYKKRGIQLLFAGLKGPVRDSFKQNRIFTLHGAEHFFLTVNDAIRYLNGEEIDRKADITMQTNFKDT